jgi:phospholipid/cholesterol/gamma-HCH transport system permease protein
VDASALRIEPAGDGGPDVDVRLSGRAGVGDAAAIRDGLAAALARAERSGGRARIDLSGLESVDGGAAAMIVEVAHAAEARGARLELAGARGSVATLVTLLAGRRRRAADHPPPERIGTLDQIGRVTALLAAEARDIFRFVGDVVAAAGAAVRAPRTVNWADVAPIAERAGADGLPIVATLCFLLGLILAFQAAIQLHQFGADIYVADGVAISVTRELGPLMVAITVAGRSGAAFAAEIGTMKVSEEVDALETIGICPFRYLVLPRLLALLLVVPLLTILGDLIALVGGFLVGVFGLSIPAKGYIIQTHGALTLAHVFSGVFKSFFFAAAIALVGCERGLSTSGGATGVGRSTTSSVVTILFHLVVIDFAFTLLFQAYGI